MTKKNLSELYLKMLKTDKQLSNESLVWIIKALIRIEEDVKQSKIFPLYLDEISIKFLIEFANIELKIDRLKLIHEKNKLSVGVSKVLNDELVE